MWWPLALVPVFPLHSLLHHVVMSSVAPFYRAFDTTTKHTWVGRMTSLTTQILALSAYGLGRVDLFHHGLGAYILADMAHMAVYVRSDWMAWIHHVLTFAAYGLSYGLSDEVNATMLYSAALLESTSPLIHLSWFANKSGYAETRWFPGLAGVTICVFFIIRCLLFPYLVLTEFPRFLWVFGIPLICMNFIWFRHLIGYARAVVTKAGGSRLV